MHSAQGTRKRLPRRRKVSQPSPGELGRAALDLWLEASTEHLARLSRLQPCPLPLDFQISTEPLARRLGITGCHFRRLLTFELGLIPPLLDQWHAGRVTQREALEFLRVGRVGQCRELGLPPPASLHVVDD